jgi:hypothetical protein
MKMTAATPRIINQFISHVLGSFDILNFKAFPMECKLSGSIVWRRAAGDVGAGFKLALSCPWHKRCEVFLVCLCMGSRPCTREKGM